MNKSALILGTGMDGTHLADLLLYKGYKVYIVGKNNKYVNSNAYYEEIDLAKNLNLLGNILYYNKFDEIYNLAANSFIDIDSEKDKFAKNMLNEINIFTQPNLMILRHIMESSREIKYFYASSCEIFKYDNESQSNGFDYDLWNLYTIGKANSHATNKYFRDMYGVYVVNGILYPHESYRRKDHFLIKKIVNKAIDWHLNVSNDPLILGDLTSERYWLHAKDVVYAMWLSLQHDISDDYIIGSEEKHTVYDVIHYVTKYLGIKQWKVEVSNNFKRSKNKYYAKPDINKIKSLGWNPKYNFESMLINIIDNQLKNRI